MLEAGGTPELVLEALTGETSLLEAGVEVEPEAAESVLMLVVVMRVEDAGEPVAEPSPPEVAVGATTTLLAAVSVEDPETAPVSTAVAEVEVRETTVLVLVETSEVVAGTIGIKDELSVLRPEDMEETRVEDGYGLGRVEAEEGVWSAAESTESAFPEEESGAGLEDGNALGNVEAEEMVWSAADSTDRAFHDVDADGEEDSGAL